MAKHMFISHAGETHEFTHQTGVGQPARLITVRASPVPLCACTLCWLKEEAGVC